MAQTGVGFPDKAWSPLGRRGHGSAPRGSKCGRPHGRGFSLDGTYWLSKLLDLRTNYTNTAADCAACHQAAYDATTQPSHLAAGFSTDCAACHSTAAWQPARFDHDGLYFRIYSGKHRDKWTSCNVCHVSPSNYVVFSCLECHEHDRTRMDDKHKDIGNYQYESSACYACHRNS